MPETPEGTAPTTNPETPADESPAAAQDSAPEAAGATSSAEVTAAEGSEATEPAAEGSEAPAAEAAPAGEDETAASADTADRAAQEPAAPAAAPADPAESASAPAEAASAEANEATQAETQPAPETAAAKPEETAKQAPKAAAAETPAPKAAPKAGRPSAERGEETEQEARDRAAAEAAEAAGSEAAAPPAPPTGTPREAAQAGEPAAAASQETAEAAGEAAEETAASEPQMPTDPVSLKLLEHLESGKPIQGKVFGWNQGGYHVLIDGLLAFCPRSEIDLGNPKAPKKYIEKTYPFQVIEHRPQGNRFIVSRSKILEEERAKKQAAVKEKLEQGAVLEGRVTSLTGFGAFVDLGGGIEGMVHVSELSHRNVDQPKDLLKKGQKVQVKVLKIEKGGDRISLSMKALEANPWKEFAEKYPRGAEFTGKITGKTDFGLFVEVEPGMEGLVHVSALPPGGSLENEAFAEGNEVSGWVKDTEIKRKRISLSLKPVPTSDPWKDVTDKYPEGDPVTGTVEEIAPFGVFINLEPGLTGLLPNSEMNLPRGTHPGRVYAPGTEVKLQVARIEAKRKRITLVPEGSKIEGSRTDFKEYKQKAKETFSGGMPTLAAAFEKLKKEGSD